MDSSSSGVSEDEDYNDLVPSRKLAFPARPPCQNVVDELSSSDEEEKKPLVSRTKPAPTKGCLKKDFKESKGSEDTGKAVCFASNPRETEEPRFLPPGKLSSLLIPKKRAHEETQDKSKKAKKAKMEVAPETPYPEKVHRRMRVATEKTVRSVMEEIDASIHTVHHVCLAWSMQDANFKPEGDLHRTHQVFSSSGSNMNLYPAWEKNASFSAGVSDFLGMVTCAGNIVSILHEDPNAVVIVSEKVSKDYAPLVCRFACILAKTVSVPLFDKLREGCPLPRHPLLRQWVKATGTLTKCKSLEALLETVERMYFEPITKGGLASFDIRPTASEMNALL